MEYDSELVSFHQLRTRRVGGQRHIDLHLVVPKETSVEDAHRICDYLEQNIGNRLRQTDITIHVEPCNEECDQCSVSCDLRKASL